MSLAATTREAVRERPFLLAALRAGVLNYAAAAEHLDLDGETDAVAAALRRFEDDLPAYETERREARVAMKRGVGRPATADEADGTSGSDTADEADAEDADEGGNGAPLLAVGGAAVAADAGSETAVVATGDVDAAALGAVLGRLAAAGIDPSAAGVAGDALAVVVGRRDGATALQIVEDALSAAPARGTA